jgi:hypothetical protein
MDNQAITQSYETQFLQHGDDNAPTLREAVQEMQRTKPDTDVLKCFHRHRYDAEDGKGRHQEARPGCHRRTIQRIFAATHQFDSFPCARCKGPHGRGQKREQRYVQSMM